MCSKILWCHIFFAYYDMLTSAVIERPANFSIIWKLCMWSTLDIVKCWLNTLRPSQNGRLFPDEIFKWVFLNENIWISIKISPKFVPKGPISNIPVLVQIMAWRRPGDKPLSETMMVRLPTHICVTRPQWVNEEGWFALLTPGWCWIHNCDNLMTKWLF